MKCPINHSNLCNMDKEKYQKRSRGIYILNPGILRIFLPQVLLGATFAILSFYIGYYHGEFILPFTMPERKIHLSNRFAYAIGCSLPMLLSLIAGIKRTAIKRAQTGANPLNSGNEHFVKLHKNYTTNTLEQFVVGLTLMLIIAAYTDNPQVLRLLPVYSFVFTVGRVVFWIGYSIGSIYRAIGMIANFTSSNIMMGMALYYIWTNGVAALLSNQ